MSTQPSIPFGNLVTVMPFLSFWLKGEMAREEIDVICEELQQRLGLKKEEIKQEPHRAGHESTTTDTTTHTNIPVQVKALSARGNMQRTCREETVWEFMRDV